MTTPDPPPAGEEETRITSLEEQDKRIDGLSEKIDRILGIVTGGTAEPPAAGEEPPGKPASIAAEIRAQLDKRDADAKSAARAEDHDKTVAELKAQIKELTEKPPAEPVKRAHKFMGWA